MEGAYRAERNERKRRELKRKKARQRLIIIGATTLVIGAVFGGVIGSSGKKDLKKEVKSLTQQLEDKTTEVEALQSKVNAEKTETHAVEVEVELPWNLTFVNPWNEMEEGYEPELAEVEEDMYVDARIVDSVKKMLSDARAAGLSPFICSAYRSVERQEQLFNDKVEEMRNIGLDHYDAFKEAATIVAEPGTSEHALGLAVDIVSVDYTTLDQGQEETEVQQWLMENCYNYGFILRYPNGTTDITGIIYEPWHYRYVGEEVALEIKELGVTFEEYLENHYQAE